MFVSTARGRALSSCPCDSLLRPQLSLGRNLLVFAGCLTLALRQVRAAAQRARPHGPRPGHEVAHASCARGGWCLQACTTRGDGSRGGRSCLVFSTHDRAGEVKRTGGSEAPGPLVRRPFDRANVFERHTRGECDMSIRQGEICTYKPPEGCARRGPAPRIQKFQTQ